MDNNIVQQLAQAIQALAAAATAPLAALAAPPPPAHISPYEGDALNLSSHTGAGLFCDGCIALSSRFMGKVEDQHLFLQICKAMPKLVIGVLPPMASCPSLWAL